MNENEFLRPRLVGPRFENGSLPLEVLQDLAVFEAFVLEVAKAKFLESAPARRRCPRGFSEGVSLRLIGLEKGSAVAVIASDYESSWLIPPLIDDYLGLARNAILAAIAAASQNAPIAGILPEKTLAFFNRLGRSLRQGEAIEFVSPIDGKPVRLTPDTRRTLLLASSSVKEITDETIVRGTIPEADQDDRTFEIQLADGRKIKAPLPVEHLENILAAFTGYQERQAVAIKGVGLFNRSRKLLALESVEHVTLLEPLDVPARLDELRLLSDGWLEGHGRAPDPAGLDWLAGAFLAHYPEELPLPYTYPTPEGGIQFEWSVGSLRASLEIDLRTRKAGWYCLDLRTEEDNESELDLSGDAGWIRLGSLVPRPEGAAE